MIGCIDAIERSCSWIARHHARFRPSPEAIARAPSVFDALKPLGELVLVLHGLTGPLHRRRRSPLVVWAERMAAPLMADLDRIARTLDWERIARRFRAQPDSAMALMIFPLIAGVARRPCAIGPSLERLLRLRSYAGVRATADLSQELLFLCELVGILDAVPELSARLAGSLRGRDATALRTREGALYSLTHDVMYVTNFGRRPPGVLEPSLRWLESHLGALTLARMDASDLDLGAELLLCQHYAGRGDRTDALEASRRLMAAIPDDGGVPAPAHARTPGMDEFQLCYHATLVCLAALAETWVRAGYGARTPVNPCTRYSRDSTS